MAGASDIDRMESQLKFLQQQALATQQSIKQLQTREAVDPWSAIRSDLAAVSTIDSTVVAVVCVLLLALAAVWKYLWHRPQTKPLEATMTVMPDKERLDSVDSVSSVDSSGSLEPLEPVAFAVSAPLHGTDEQPSIPVPLSAFAQREAGSGFDPEAAANEVMRVRKSLAGKREARSLSLEREDMQGAHQSLAQQELHPVEIDLELEPETADDEPISFSLAPHPPAAAPGPKPEPESENDSEAPTAGAPLTATAIEPRAETARARDPVPMAGSTLDPPDAYDYSITLALAEESEALELWTEARELAHEVLQSNNPVLQSQAQVLLQRLPPPEHAARHEARLWDQDR